MLHIGIDASRLGGPAQTGTERYSRELVGAMARLERDYHCTLYCNGLPASLPPLGPNVALRNIPFPRLWTQARLSWEMWHRPPDVLFVPAHVLPAIHPPRSIVTIHDLGYLAFPEAHTAARRLDLHLTTRWNTRTAHRIIAVSHATRDDLITHYGVVPAKIRVVHHGVSPHFRPISNAATLAEVRNRYALPRRYVLYIGTLQPRKNIVRLIDAFAQVVQQEPASTPVDNALHLVLAGKRGWLSDPIERRATEQHIAGRVHMVGYVNDGDLPALLSGALVFAFPSLAEGFGMPVLEAMACGTPVLTSTTTSLPEVAGDAALLVNPHDTGAIAEGLARLATDATLRETLREGGLARAGQFTWERCARETLRVLLEDDEYEDMNNE